VLKGIVHPKNIEILSFVYPHVLPNTSDLGKKKKDVRQSALVLKIRGCISSKYIILAERKKKNVDLLVLFYHICLQLKTKWAPVVMTMTKFMLAAFDY